MKTFITVISSIVILSSAQAQSIKPLTIGDNVPDFVFNDVWNYKTKKAKLSDFNGKLVILDMWATTCSACIAAFPKMSALQKEFEGKLQILLANPHKTQYETAERIKKVVDNYKKRTGDALSLPMPLFDTILNKYFPHESVPHVIWIDDKGRVIAITSSTEIKEENIRSILNGEKLSLPVKNDYYDFNSRVPLLLNGNGGPDDAFIFRSVFTKYNSAVKTMIGWRRNESNEIIGYYVFNYPLNALIRMAYADKFQNSVSGNRIIYGVANIRQLKEHTDTANRYCYDVTFPPLSGRTNFNTQINLREDLASAFNIRVTVEKRKVTSYVLTFIGRIENANTKYSKPENDLDKSSIKKYLHNYSIDQAVKILEPYVDKPLINETGIQQKIDIDFPDNFDLTNQQAIIVFLKKTGFQIKQEQRELEVVVITDKKD